MARPRDSRSPSPAGSHHSSRRYDRRNDRDDRDRPRRRSRSRSPDQRDRYRGPRDRDRRRDRSVDRRDDHYRGGRRDYRDHRDRDRDRRRSRDRFDDRRSPDRRRDRSRDDDRYRRRDDSRDRGARARREGTADSGRRRDTPGRTPHGENGKVDSRDVRPRSGGASDSHQTPKPTPEVKSDAEKKAERLAKLEAWKKKKEAGAQKEKGVNPVQTRSLLAEMDKKTPGGTPVAGSPQASPGAASPATPAPFTGKFDPKAIAKKAAARSHEASQSVLGSVDGQPEKLAGPVKEAATASALPANRSKTSAFGLGKSQADDKLPSKRKLDLDEEETTKRKLTKLPALPVDTDDTPYADQDEDDDEEVDHFAETEEEAAAAARAAHEKRQAEADNAEDKMDTSADQPADQAQANGVEVVKDQPKPAAPAPVPEKMEVDKEEHVDPLDAFMAGLEDAPSKWSALKSNRNKMKEPEAFLSDDDIGPDSSEDEGAKKLLETVNKRKKKDIPTVDYSKLDLQPVRKNFWVEPSELRDLSEADLADLRLELDGIKVKGENVPKPVQKWSQCGLSRQTLDIIGSLGFEKPTPIQMQALPVIMSGRDVIGVAKTGSGKTAAFLLPMFRHIMDQPPIKDTDGPIGLIMTPTRELAVQIQRDCKPFLKMMGLRAMCAYGGSPIRDQIAELKRGAEIIVGTPGRVIDLLTANQGRVTNLRRVSYIVLDEADRMFDMGFEPQVMKIFANMRPDKQTILFSATMPRIVDSLTKKVLKKPIEITVGGRSVVAKEIEQVVEVREESTKFVRVLALLGDLYENDEDVRSLIFVERQEKADELWKELTMKNYLCTSIHGGKDQVDRDQAISDFKRGAIPIMIATSVAARGLDVKQLKLVINYDAPNHLEDYVHRAGRTGRAGNTGVAVTFVTPQQEHCAPGIAKALEQSGQPVPDDIEEMRKAHREKVKSGKAKDTSGFGGKGLDRLDAEREANRMRERKTHKAEGEEAEEEKKDEDQKKKEEDAKVEKALSAYQKAAADEQSKAKGDIKEEETKIKKEEIDTEMPLGVVKKGPAPGSEKDKKNKTPLDKVSSAVNAINSRLGKAGQLRAGQPIDNKGPDAGAFHATLEINDFPQKARWAVTNRSNVAKILEATGTSITSKGQYYPPGTEVPPGAEPKLYILIEGDTEVVVSSALQELTRHLREGTIAAADAEARAPAGSRYVVT